MNFNKFLLVALMFGIFLIFSIGSINSVAAADKDIYVAVNGNDTTNLGNSSKSPYATMDKAISESGHKDAVTIHLSEGTFRGSGNSLLTINKAHRTQGGNITIVGAGYNKTILDGYYNSHIFEIKLDSVVILKNLTFINGKNVNGGVISSNGTLKIVDCIFDNNRAVNSGGSIYATTGNCSIYNSTFNNNSAFQGGVIFFGSYSSSGTLNVDNSVFTNNYVQSGSINQANGGAIYSRGTSTLTTITNSLFINNSAISDYHFSYPNSVYVNRGGSVYMGSGYLVNNSFVSSSITGDAPLGSAFYIETDGIYTVENNLRINCSINGVLEPNIYTPGYDGVYLEDTIDVFVSPTGDDINGAGSKNSPYATILKAINSKLSFTMNLVIHLLPGNYTGSGNVRLELPNHLNLKIIGSGHDTTIIDGEGLNWIFKFPTVNLGYYFTISSLTINNPVSFNVSGNNNVGAIVNYCNLVVENLIFKNSTGTAISNEGNGNLTVVNSSFINNSAYSYGLLSRNGGAIYNVGQTLSIYNSTFIANYARYDGSAIYSRGDSKVITLLLVNSTIINSISIDSSDGSAVFLAGTNFTAINSTFINNSGSDININWAYEKSCITLCNVTFKNSAGIVSDSRHPENIFWNVYNSSFINLNQNLTFNCFGNGNIFSGNIFEGNFSLILLGTNITNSVVLSNSTILVPVLIGSNTTYNFNYNWWGNIKPSFQFYNGDGSGSSYTLNRWVMLNLASDDSPGLSRNIFLTFTVTNGTSIFNYDTSKIPRPTEEFNLTTSNGSIHPRSGNLASNNFTALFSSNQYGLYNIKATFNNGLILSLDLEIYHEDSNTKVTLSKTTGENGGYVDVTVDVTRGGGSPVNKGYVEFFLSGTSLGTVEVINGRVTKRIQVTGPDGQYKISAKYLGTDGLSESSDVKLYQVVTVDNVAPTVTKLDPANAVVKSAKVIKVTFSEAVKAGSLLIDLKNSSGKAVQCNYSISGNTLTITPKSALGSGKYTMVLRNGAVTDLTGNKLVLYSSSFTMDAVAPKVSKIDPTNGATKVAAGKTIKVTFSEVVKAGSKFWVDLKNSSGKAVAFKYKISGNTLTVDPTKNLAESKYTLVLHSGALTDLAGNALAAKSSSFIVGAAPKISKVDPKNGATKISAGKTIKITFNENIKKGSKFWVDLKNSSGKAVAFKYKVSGKTLTIDPKSNLAESRYTLVIHAGAVTDLAGNPVAAKSTKFSVGKAPTVSKVDPKNGATKVARTKTIKVNFNENIKKGNYKIVLKNSKGKTVKVTKSISGKVLSIKHAKLAVNTKYKLYIYAGAVTDKAVNPVAAKTYSFTTGKT